MGAVWQHDGKLYDYESYYDLDADSWTHEVRALDGESAVWIDVPDGTPDAGPFTPLPKRAVFRSSDGALPLVIVERLLAAAREAGDIN